MKKLLALALLSSAALAPLAAHAQRIGVTMVNYDDTFRTLLRNGVADAAKKAGATVQFEDAKSDVGNQLSQIQNMIAQKYDAIIVQAVDTDVTPKILKWWIMRVETKAGLPKTGRLHVYRHTFASHLAMAGVPAKTIQELCRHASLSMTMRYMHLSPSATMEGIEMLTKSRVIGGRSVTSSRGPESNTG